MISPWKLQKKSGMMFKNKQSRENSATDHPILFLDSIEGVHMYAEHVCRFKKHIFEF